MVKLWRTTQDILTLLSTFARKVIDYMTTPMEELFSSDNPLLDYILEHSDWFFDLFGNATLLEFMLSTGLGVVLVWGIIKFFLPTS